VSAAAPMQTTTATVMAMAVAAAAKEAAANAAVATVVAAIAGEATEAEVIAAETTLKAKPRAIPEIMTTMAAIAEAQMLLMVDGRLQMTDDDDNQPEQSPAPTPAAQSPASQSRGLVPGRSQFQGNSAPGGEPLSASEEREAIDRGWQ
jgi:hypothetical protein